MKEGKNQFNFTTIFKGFLTAFNINRGLIPTLRDLLINPAIVINYYIEGKIDKYGYNKYFSPGRFFVTVLAILSVFAFFAVDVSDIMNEVYEKGVEAKMASKYDGDLSKEESIAADSANKTSIKVAMFFFNNPMFAFLLLILPSALTTRLVFRSVNYNNLAKHFVVNIYCFCFIALATGILSAFFNQEEYLMYYLQQIEDSKNNIKTDILWKWEFYNYFFFIMPILYYFYAFKNIFNLSWISSIFKTVISLVLSGAIIFFFAVLLVITLISL